MKILMAIDGSTKSLEAIGSVGGFLNARRDQVVMYYSPPKINLPDESRLDASIGADIRLRLLQDVFEKSLEQLPVDLRGTVEMIRGEKRPEKGILLAAKQHDVDLIVVGADGRRDGFIPYLGRVARTVARQSEVPVLVYRRAEYQTGKVSAINMLLAHDGSPASSEAGETLGRFKWPDNTTGAVVRVMEFVDIRLAGDPMPPGLLLEDYESYIAESKKNAAEQLKEKLTGLPDFLKRESPRILSGSVVQSLANHCREFHCNLLVIAPHKRRLNWSILGATTESLLHYAPCSVLVWHGAERP
jgi:nucleotide-binding universal stress UspA family protein